jgi:hypothetical protein
MDVVCDSLVSSLSFDFPERFSKTVSMKLLCLSGVANWTARVPHFLTIISTMIVTYMHIFRKANYPF